MIEVLSQEKSNKFKNIRQDKTVILNEFSDQIWKNSYKAEEDITIFDTWNRIAKHAALVECSDELKQYWKDKFYELLYDFGFVPGGRIIANLGVSELKETTLMNCFVHSPLDLQIESVDSIEGIYELLKAQAHTLKSEGGYGMNFSWLRPAGTYIKGIGSRTPGVLSFMDLWNLSSKVITSGYDGEVFGKRYKNEKNKIRKGAQMGMLSVWHPDIEQFITAKQTANRFDKFNLSVVITSGFMEAVKNNEVWNLIFPDTTFEKYDTEWDGNIEKWLSNEYPTRIYKTVMAKELWEKIMLSTYNRNEPGIFFSDITNKLNPLYYAETVVTTNPCAEIPMSTGVCNLGSLNLVKFIKISELGDVEFDFDAFADAVQVSIRFLDNINDISNVPLQVYKESMIKKRRIGLGVLGLGSLHFILGMEYGSSESLYFIKKLYKCKAYNELLASAKLGKEKGSFELFDFNKYFNSYWWKTLDILPDEKQYIESFGAMRNSHRSMSAPTGQTSVFSEQVSSGIEPVFFKEYYRWVICSDDERRKLRQNGFNFPNINNNEFYETEHLKYSQRGDETVLSGEFNGEAFEYDKNRGLVKRSLVEDYGWKWIKEHGFINPNMQYKTAEELTIEEHIKPLEIIAHYTDQAVSKTVNVETSYSYENFKQLYFKAWNARIKGITTYRAGTMTAVIEDVKKVQEYQNELEKLFKENPGVILEHVKLPKQYFSKGHIIKDNHKKKWYVNIAFADSEYKHPFAIFVTTNNKESNEVTEDLISDVISLCRVKGIKQEFIDDLIHKYTGQTNISKICRALGMCLRHNIPLIEIINLLDVYTVEISSFLFHLKKLLSTYIDNGTVIESEECPNCGPNTIIFQDGCISCKNCGYARC